MGQKGLCTKHGHNMASADPQPGFRRRGNIKHFDKFSLRKNTQFHSINNILKASFNLKIQNEFKFEKNKKYLVENELYKIWKNFSS